MTQSKTDPAVIEVSRKIYETSLALYPEDLRDEYGEEMIEVFKDQVSDAYHAHGVRGLLRVWLCTAQEFITIAIGGQIAAKAVPVLAAATALALMVWLAGFMATPIVADKACGH